MSIRAKQKFYNKAVALGIDMANVNYDLIDLSQPNKHKSSFKKRASEIKELYNYRFPVYVEPRVIDLGVCYLEFEKL